MMAAQSVCCWIHFATDFYIRWVLEKPEFPVSLHTHSMLLKNSSAMARPRSGGDNKCPILGREIAYTASNRVIFLSRIAHTNVSGVFQQHHSFAHPDFVEGCSSELFCPRPGRLIAAAMSCWFSRAVQDMPRSIQLLRRHSR